MSSKSTFQPDSHDYRSAILALTALTLHFSVLSITLHISRASPGPRYKASSAVVLTEALKIIVAIALIFASGELRPTAQERRRIRWENELLLRDPVSDWRDTDQHTLEITPSEKHDDNYNGLSTTLLIP